MIIPLQPAVYKINQNEDSSSVDGYTLELHKDRYIVNGKNYGDIDKHVNIFWDRFMSSKSNLGVMLTGSPGSGKTRTSELLANRGIDNNMCVVEISEVSDISKLVDLIYTLCNMVIIFDEFSKNFPIYMQSKMLTMFSATTKSKNMFILTENDRRTVSQFIRTRPGRIRYAVDYDRIKSTVIDEYCYDYGIPESYKRDIYNIYDKADKFTFDHLQALVSEKLSQPDATIDEILELLNLDDLVPEDIWEIANVVCSKTLKPYELIDRGNVLTKREINSSYRKFVVLIKDPANAIGANNNNFVHSSITIEFSNRDIANIDDLGNRRYKLKDYIINVNKVS